MQFVGLALIFFALLSLAFSQSTEMKCPPNYQPPDSCTAGPCRCAQFQTVRIQTNTTTQLTEVIIRVTNTCPDPVYYAQFSLSSEDGKFDLSQNWPTQNPATFQGSAAYQWTESIVDGSQSATKTTPAIKWIRFAAKLPGNPNTQMVLNSAQNNYEEFRFFVKNYSPVFPWIYQLHQGSNWDTFGPLDMSLCACTNCDASASVRVIESCNLRYPDDSSNLSPSTFNENEVLYSFQIEGNQLELFYSDEHAMSLAVSTVVNNGLKTPFTTTPSSTTDTPKCVSGAALQLGSWNFDARDPLANIDGNNADTGCKEDPNKVLPTCGRPLPPAMFYTDITADALNRSGDWQQGGKAIAPQKICGLWKSATKTITGRDPTTNVYAFSITTPTNPPSNKNPAGTGWILGTGSDPLPLGFVNPTNTKPAINAYGTEVMWDLDLLNLNPSHRYRFQFMVHDGDQTKIGGDVGQACIVASAACKAGFAGATCTQCENDLTIPGNQVNQYTWYCYPTGGVGDDFYRLIKIPFSKYWSDPIYNASGGFIPKTGVQDSEGYFVTCDCKRIPIDCPENCCGHGQCNPSNGQCTCSGTGLNRVTCCPTDTSLKQCVNDGNYCSGNGYCTDGQCACFNGPDGTPDFTGVACNITVEKKRKCTELPATDCASCQALAEANGVYCGWCTSGTATGSDISLSDGKCTSDTECTAAGNVSLPSCTITAEYIPEPCPDNCTGHGTCTNETQPLPPNAPNGTQPNVTQHCVCAEGYTGLNCATAPPIAAIVGLTAGAIAGIVIGVIVFLCISGGGAWAAAKAMGPGSVGPVINNPLYKGDGQKGTNPLYQNNMS